MTMAIISSVERSLVVEARASMRKAIDVVFFMVENRGMIGIGGDPLAADDQQLSQGTYILVLSGRDANLIGHGFGHDRFLVIRSPGGAIRQCAGYVGPELFPDHVPNLETLL